LYDIYFITITHTSEVIKDWHWKKRGGGEATQNEYGVTDKILRPIDLISQHIYTVIIYTMACSITT